MTSPRPLTVRALALLALVSATVSAADAPPLPDVPADLPEAAAAVVDRAKADVAADLAAKRGKYFVAGPPRAYILQFRDVMREDHALTVVALGCIMSTPQAEYVTAYNAALGAALVPGAAEGKAFEPEHRKAQERWERDQADAKARKKAAEK